MTDFFWNYRIVNTKTANGGEDWYCIQEVVYDENGKPEPHDERSRVRAAGSMDTTITDLATFSAAMMRGWHALNCERLGVPGLGFVCTGQAVDGKPGLEAVALQGTA